jgi:hypothetical protein
MRSISIVLLLAISCPMLAGCHSGGGHGTDDARPAPDALLTVDAGVPDASPDAGPVGAPITHNVSGSVNASSAHYRMIGATSAGGGPASSGSYQRH